MHTNEGFAGFVTDEELNVRFGVRLTPDGGAETLKPADGGGWDLFMKVKAEDLLTTEPEGFDKTGRILYLSDSRDRDTAALVTIDLDTGQETTVAEDARSDVSDLMVHPTEKDIQAVAFTYDLKKWHVRDPAVGVDLERLSAVADDDIEVVSRTLDDRQWIVAFMTDDGPVRFYRYDRDRKTADFIFANREALEALPLTKMQVAVVKSRDGLDMVCYYSLPVWSAGPDGDRPTSPLPMVLDVHGGPWARDEWGYDPIHQLLANRGYAVLSVNFRGSTGFGKSFTNAGDLEWGRKMHEDLIDAVQWAVDRSIADPERVAIFGGSYGGYASLVGLTFTPDFFRCGVDIVVPSNLVTLLESVPPYWEPEIEAFAKRVGDHRTDEGRALLIERSPLSQTDRIKKPLLIAQGGQRPTGQAGRVRPDRGGNAGKEHPSHIRPISG